MDSVSFDYSVLRCSVSGEWRRNGIPTGLRVQPFEDCFYIVRIPRR
jgi:hypothetical protein